MNLHLPTRPTQWSMFVFAATVALVLFALGELINSLLQYHAQRIDAGEWWRLLTGHLLHTNLNHLLLNLGGLLVLWALHGDYYQLRNSFLLLLLLCLGTSGGLMFGSDIVIYVGLSGVLHGLFTWGVVTDIRRGMLTGWLLLVGLIIKLAQEQLYGASLNTALMIEADVAVDAHLYGALAGLICSTFIRAADSPQR